MSFSYREISLEELNAWFEKTNFKEPCDQCGTDAWSVNGLEEGNVPSFEIYAVGESAKPAGKIVPVVTIHCTNCGLMRVYNRKVLQNRLDAMKDE